MAGGLSYDYRIVKEIGSDGELVRGKRELDQEQASIIQQIFNWYRTGMSPRAIAGKFNANAS